MHRERVRRRRRQTPLACGYAWMLPHRRGQSNMMTEACDRVRLPSFSADRVRRTGRRVGRHGIAPMARLSKSDVTSLGAGWGYWNNPPSVNGAGFPTFALHEGASRFRGIQQANRVSGVVLMALFLGACGSDAPSGPIPVATIQVTSPIPSVVVGASQQFSATTFDASGAVLSGRPIAWTSRDPTVATVTQSGLATGVAPGVTVIEATSEGKRGERTLFVIAPAPPAPPVSASGRLYMIDGLAPGPLTAALRIGTTPPASAVVGADGRFDVSSAAQGDPVDLVIDGPSGAYLPSLLRIPRSSLPATEIRILLAPRRWTIAAGTYASQTIDVSANQAFTPPCTTAGDTNCDGYYSRAWATGIKVWDD